MLQVHRWQHYRAHGLKWLRACRIKIGAEGNVERTGVAEEMEVEPTDEQTSAPLGCRYRMKVVNTRYNHVASISDQGVELVLLINRRASAPEIRNKRFACHRLMQGSWQPCDRYDFVHLFNSRSVVTRD
jgi:hypothetical protein